MPLLGSSPWSPFEKANKSQWEIIGSRVGRLIKVEAHCDGLLLYRNFLRIRVDVDVTKPLPRGFILNRGENAQMTSVDPWISFKYEKLSDFCYDCGRIGHDRNVCKFVSREEGQKSGYGPDLQTGTARSSGFPVKYYRKKVDALEATVKPLLHRQGPQSSPVPPMEARGNGARDGEILRPTTVTEDSVSIDIHEQQPPISGVEISGFPSAEGCSNLAKAAVGPRMEVRSGPSGFGPDMQASPQYFVTEPVETIGPVTKDSSFLSKAHSGGPLEIEEVSPATSPVRQDLKTRVIDDCMSIVFNFLSLKRKAHESDLQDASQPKLLKRDGLTTIPIKTIEFPSTFTQISSVVPNSGIKDKARKIVRRRRRSGEKGLIDVEVALVESPDAQEAQSLLWTDEVNIDIRFKSKNLIRGVVSPPDKLCNWAVAFVYAPPQRGNRRGFWGQFKKMVSENKYPFLCIGDFNEIGAMGEKQGGVDCRMSQIQLFVELLSDCAIMDLEFNGAPYTWSNNQLRENNIRERLDRAVATIDWRALYSCAQVFHEVQVGSDHCPIILNCCLPLKKIPRLFKFETMWSTSPDCVELIRSKWASDVSGSNMFQLVHKLKECRSGLKEWSKLTFGNNKICIAQLKSELSKLQAQSPTDENLQLQGQLKTELECVLAREEMYLHQRSRIRWLSYGDKNSAFFHASMIQRRQRNQILKLQTEEGFWLNSDQDIKHHMYGSSRSYLQVLVREILRKPFRLLNPQLQMR
ncbi:hypothetical protein ACSBR2_028466 [Camellia fascicularis]